jgi:hypothetical protein
MSKKEIALSKEAALKEIRQIEEETILAICAAKALVHKKMSIYITEAAREAGESLLVPAPQEDIFSAVAQDLYNYLNRFEISLPARKPGTINN